MTLTLTHTLKTTEVPITHVKEITHAEENEETIRENELIQFNWIEVCCDTPKELQELTPNDFYNLQLPQGIDHNKGIVFDFSRLTSAFLSSLSTFDCMVSQSITNQWLVMYLLSLVPELPPVWVGIFNPSKNKIIIPWNKDVLSNSIDSLEYYNEKIECDKTNSGMKLKPHPQP